MGLEENRHGAAIRATDGKLFHFHASDRSVPDDNLVGWADLAQAASDIAYQGSAVIESFNCHSCLGPHAYRREHQEEVTEAAEEESCSQKESPAEEKKD